ncbi:MAG: ATP-binding protein [Gemmatimonadetes bacterium]|nr:ATP-binding protein [Gemmatimonadota bacterium]
MWPVARGKRVRFHKVIERVTLLIEAREERHLGRLKTQLAKLDLLILDELGYVPASKLGAELLFDVISSAYERSSLMVTTHLPFENWTEVLGRERLTGATLDRLTHRGHIIECNGESYRLKDAKRRRRKTPKRLADGCETSRLPWGNPLRRFPPTPSLGFFPQEGTGRSTPRMDWRCASTNHHARP